MRYKKIYIEDNLNREIPTGRLNYVICLKIIYFYNVILNKNFNRVFRI